jgi:hypothetical protein
MDMSTASALAQIGLDETGYLAAGEILDLVSRDHTNTISRAELEAELVELVTGPEGNLPWKFMPRHIGADELLQVMHSSLAWLLDHRVLREDAGQLGFVIQPGFSFQMRTSSEREKQVVSERITQLRAISTIPRSTVFTTTAPGQDEGQLQRAVNVSVSHCLDWMIARGRSGAGVDWQPPSLVYAGAGRYWRHCIAVDDVAALMAMAIERADAHTAALPA